MFWELLGMSAIALGIVWTAYMQTNKQSRRDILPITIQSTVLIIVLNISAILG